MQFQTLLAMVMASASAVMATHEIGQGCQKSAVDTYGCTANGDTLVKCEWVSDSAAYLWQSYTTCPSGTTCNNGKCGAV